MVLLTFHLQRSAVTISEDAKTQAQNPMLKLERLVLAMAEHEGWEAPGAPNFPNGSLSYRNNNPGNLRNSPFQVGVRDGFSVFKTEADGWAAMKWDILQKCRGQTMTGLGPKSTLSQLINKWAPPGDGNNTSAYLKAVLQMTGFDATMPLSQFL